MFLSMKEISHLDCSLHSGFCLNAEQQFTLLIYVSQLALETVECIDALCTEAPV